MIMPDQKTLLGVDGKTKKSLIQEDITCNKSPIITLCKHDSIINTLSFNQSTDTLMVGDDSSTCVQYKRRGGDWKIVRKFRNLGIGWVMSSKIINGNLCILGGWNSHIRVIDMGKAEVLGDPFHTGVQGIYSMQVSRVMMNQEEKYLLYLTGENLDWSKDRSNVYDVTHITNKYARRVEEVYKKKAKMVTITQCELKAYNTQYRELKEEIRRLRKEDEEKKNKIIEIEQFYEEENRKMELQMGKKGKNENKFIKQYKVSKKRF